MPNPDNGAAQGEKVKDPENDDLRQKIEKKIQELETQIALNVKQIESFKNILNQ
ncbi:hypothetical protein [Nostoc sp.]|uniref:hypothetical protein n=1 Tax=Nostoc sp. TaxID=1180 RepID=UPI002FF8BE41